MRKSPVPRCSLTAWALLPSLEELCAQTSMDSTRQKGLQQGQGARITELAHAEEKKAKPGSLGPYGWLHALLRWTLSFALEWQSEAVPTASWFGQDIENTQAGPRGTLTVSTLWLLSSHPEARAPDAIQCEWHLLKTKISARVSFGGQARWNHSPLAFRT